MYINSILSIEATFVKETGRFAYKSFRLQVVSPTLWLIRLHDQSRFAYNELLII